MEVQSVINESALKEARKYLIKPGIRKISAIASAAFANTYNDGNNGGYGVENQFTYEDGEWQWNQKPVE